MPAAVTTRRTTRPDAVCAAAVDLAKDAILSVAASDVGDHLGVVAEDERLVTHQFECLRQGYRGWRWAVLVTRIPRSKQVTVCETVLLPGPDAILAPAWVPWQERLRPGDVGVGDVLPTAADDDRLVPGYVQSDDPAVAEAEPELGLGRPRVMSRQGRIDAAQRWYEGIHGPTAPIAKAAPKPARCSGCGFYLPLAGVLGALFGVCGNVYAPDDGAVVSTDHGCGAHSEIALEPGPAVEALPTVYDDSGVDPVARGDEAP